MSNKAETRGKNKNKDTMTAARWTYIKGLVPAGWRLRFVAAPLHKITDAVTQVVSYVIGTFKGSAGQVRGNTYVKPKVVTEGVVL